MIKVDFSERSTWRGVTMIVAGLAGLYLIGPEIVAISKTTDSAQLQFVLSKVTALATAIGLAGQTASGLIGIIFSDKGQGNV